MSERRGRHWGGILIVLVLLAGYIAVQLIPVMMRGYETQTAVTSTLADAVPAKGIAVREEQTLEYSGTGVLTYLVEDGSRVAPGAAVGEIFASEAQARSWQNKEKLDAQLEMLGQSQTQELSGGTDIEQLLKQQQQGLLDLLDLLKTGRYDGLDEVRNQLTLAANRMQNATGAQQDLSAQIAALTAERDAAAAAAGTVEYLYAPTPGGYYSSMTDGLEQTITPQALESVDAAGLAQMIDSSQAKLTQSAGKLVSNYEWYFYCLVDAKETERFINENGEVEVELDFDDPDLKEIPAKVVSVEQDPDGGPTKVVLLCDYINAGTVNLRVETAQISFARYKGVCIAQSAVHIVTDEEGNQKRGVYVKYGNMLEFKQIDPIFENEEYVIVPAKTRVGSDEQSLKNEVLLYDEIVVSGKDLYDGKLL